MKKFVSIVLALALALSLCTVAFAAGPFAGTDYPTGDPTLPTPTTPANLYDVKNAGDLSASAVEDVKLVKYAEKVSKKAEDFGNVEFFGLDHTSFDGEYFVKVADSEDADLVVYKAGKTAVEFYLKKLVSFKDAFYYWTKSVAEVSVLGDKCEQLDEDVFDDVDVYKVVLDEDVVVYGTDEAITNVTLPGGSDGFRVLYKGEVLKLYPFSFVAEMNGHDWEEATTNDDDEVITYKCADCGKVATYYEKEATAKAKLGSDYVWETLETGRNYYYVVNAMVAGNSSSASTTVDSSKTFDAGVAMYVGLSLMSVAGSAVVIGKKKEF